MAGLVKDECRRAMATSFLRVGGCGDSGHGGNGGKGEMVVCPRWIVSAETVPQRAGVACRGIFDCIDDMMNDANAT